MRINAFTAVRVPVARDFCGRMCNLYSQSILLFVKLFRARLSLADFSACAKSYWHDKQPLKTSIIYVLSYTVLTSITTALNGNMSRCVEKSCYQPRILPARRLIASRISADSEILSKRSRLAHQTLCPHCNQLLADQTFRRHKQLYLTTDGSWITSESPEGI